MATKVLDTKTANKEMAAEEDSLRKQLNELDDKKWAQIRETENLASKFHTAHMLYEFGLEKENEALSSYFRLLERITDCDCLLDDEDKQVLMEIIADELNHVRKLQGLAKKYQTIKATLR